MAIPNPLLDPFKNFFFYNRRCIYIDNLYFRVHYVWTVLLLLVFKLLLTLKIYFGDSINCLASPDIKDIVAQYCFIHSTFTRGNYDKKGGWTYEPVKDNEIYPGVRPGVQGDKIIYHSYYQWVWFVLIIQAISFYFPHWVWEKMGSATTMMLVGDLNIPMLPEENKIKHRKKILLYLRRTRGEHNHYAYGYIFCEILNFINILIQIVATNYFVGNEFTTYGLRIFGIIQTKPYLRDDELSRVFPTVTACRIATGGVAFGKVQHDVLCVLPINILNEKIYIVLWFWFLIVLISSVMCLVYRACTVSKAFRRYIFRQRVRGKCIIECGDSLCDANKYGEWFLIYKLSQNMDTVTFGDLVQDIDQAFRKWDCVKLPDEEMHLDPSPPSSVDFSPAHGCIVY